MELSLRGHETSINIQKDTYFYETLLGTIKKYLMASCKSENQFNIPHSFQFVIANHSNWLEQS